LKTLPFLLEYITNDYWYKQGHKSKNYILSNEIISEYFKKKDYIGLQRKISEFVNVAQCRKMLFLISVENGDFLLQCHKCTCIIQNRRDRRHTVQIASC
jgi:hypothetical protein